MSSNDSPQNNSDWTWDDWDNIPESTDDPSGVKDPTENPEAWDICRDFIDPLADELEKRSRCSIDDIEALEWFGVGMDGVGPAAYTNAWERVRIELGAYLPGHVCESFELYVRGLVERAKEAAREFTELSGKDDEDASWQRDVVMKDFAVNVVEPCLGCLRNTSAVLKRRMNGTEERSRRPSRAPSIDENRSNSRVISRQWRLLR